MNENQKIDTETLKEDGKEVLKWAIKPTIGTKVYSGVYKELKHTGEQTFSVMKWVLSPKKPQEQLLPLKNISDYKERFKISMKMRRIKEKNLPEIEKEMEWNLFAWLGAIALFFIYFIVTSGHDFLTLNFKIFTILPVIGMFSLLLSLAARASFRLYQIRERACMPFSDWLSNPKVWFGGKFSGLTSFLILGIMFSAVAKAETETGGGSGLGAISSYMDSVSSSDLSLKWLKNLFPDATTNLTSVSALSSSSANSGTDLFRDMFQIMNSIILGVACAMMTYQTVIGTIATAHEGEVLGRRWNTAFAPARIVLGIGSLAPIKGYCLAQMLAVYVLFAGYSMADAIWVQEVKSITSGTPIVPSTKIPDDGTLALDIVQSKICAQFSQDNTYTFFQHLTSDIGSNVNPTLSSDNANGKMVLNFGTACGSVTFNGVSSAQSELSKVGTQKDGVGNEFLSIFSSKINDAIAKQDSAFSQFSQDRTDAVNKLITSIDSNGWIQKIAKNSEAMGQAGNKIDLSGIGTYISGIASAQAAYDSSMNTAISKLTNSAMSDSQSAMVDLASSLGWASAGALNNSLLQISSSIQKAVDSTQAQYTPPDLSQFSSSSQKKISNLLNNFNQQIRGMSTTLNSSTTGKILVQNQESSNPTSVIDKIFNSSGLGDGSWTTSMLSLSSTNPMGSIQSQGMLLITAASAMFATFLAISAAVSGEENGLLGTVERISPFSFSGATSGIIRLITPMVYMSIGSILAYGIVEAYILPMIPYIMWTFAIFECAAFAICFVVAAPFAAFMHVRLDGDELIGNPQSVYYRMLFDGAVRPTLLLFGLIAFTKIFAIMAGYTDATFSVAMASARGSWGFAYGLGIFGFIADIGMLIYLHYQLCTKSMELIHRAPDMVARICGIQSAFADPGHVTHQFSGAAIGTGRMASTTANRSMQDAVSRGKQEKAQNEQRAQQKIRDEQQNARDNRQDQLFEKVLGGSVDTSAEPIAHGKTGGNDSSSSEGQNGQNPSNGEEGSNGSGSESPETNDQPKEPGGATDKE